MRHGHHSLFVSEGVQRAFRKVVACRLFFFGYFTNLTMMLPQRRNAHHSSGPIIDLWLVICNKLHLEFNQVIYLIVNPILHRLPEKKFFCGSRFCYCPWLTMDVPELLNGLTAN